MIRKLRDKFFVNEYGPNAHVEFIIYHREERLKSMPIREMTFLEQRRYLALKWMEENYSKTI